MCILDQHPVQIGPTEVPQDKPGASETMSTFNAQAPIGAAQPPTYTALQKDPYFSEHCYISKDSKRAVMTVNGFGI